MLVLFSREINLIDNLKAILFIDIDIMETEFVIIDMWQKKIILGSYNIDISIKIKYWLQFAQKLIYPVQI